MRQLLAFEEGVEDWWLVVSEGDLTTRLLALTGEGEGDSSFAHSLEECADGAPCG